MRVIIINGGKGERMGGLVKNKPKCLVELIKGETILGRQLKILEKHNLKKITMLTDYLENKIKEYMKNQFPQFQVEYLPDLIHVKKNYIYSLSLIKEIDEDLILMHGDMVFDEIPFKRLIDSNYPNAVLMNKNLVPEKDFKGRVTNGFVTEIGVNVFGDGCYFLAPMYKMSKNKFSLWLKEIKQFVERGEINVYAENAFNKISSSMDLRPVYFTELCNEVDNKQDLINMKNKLYN